MLSSPDPFTQYGHSISKALSKSEIGDRQRLLLESYERSLRNETSDAFVLALIGRLLVAEELSRLSRFEKAGLPLP